MARIPRAFNILEKREMNVSDYEMYLKMHPHRSSLNVIKCVECGDFLTFCNGEKNVSYFKHSPSHEGHSYCSLYCEGAEAKTYEALIRKKLFQEEDISLNYELLYSDKKWTSLITIPPLKNSEIENNEHNETLISIKGFRDAVEIPIDSRHFLPGEIKKVRLNHFYTKIHIRIQGNSTKHDISYNMDGFNPSTQLYSNLILQNFIHDDEDKVIDVRNIESFVCKRISGCIYTGRHYFVFSKDSNFAWKCINRKSIKIKKINLPTDNKFNYYLYDIVFTEVDEFSEEFCNNRNCELVQKDDAIIIWPPIKTVGNYRYYPNRQTNMFISFQSESKALDIAKCETYNKLNGNMYLFFKIHNINSNSYYVTMDKRTKTHKEAALILNSNEMPQNADFFEKVYYFNDDVYLQPCDVRIKLRKKSGLLYFNNQLEKIFYRKNSSSKIDEKMLLLAIRYSQKFVHFENKYFHYLLKKYDNNAFVKEYLEHCNIVGSIKEKALELLLGE